MRRGRISTMALALGLGVAPATAQEPTWRAVRLGSPTEAAPSIQAPLVTIAPPGLAKRGVSLGMPHSNESPGTLQPIGFTARGQAPEAAVPIVQPKPMIEELTTPKEVAPAPMPVGPTSPPASPIPTPTAMQNAGLPILGGTCCSSDTLLYHRPTYALPGLLRRGPLLADAPLYADADGSEIAAVPGQWWVGVDYLLYWAKGFDTPPILTTNPSVATNAIPGVDPGTIALLGGGNLLPTRVDGVRASAGLWLDETQTRGLEGSIFVLGTRAASFRYSSPPLPVLSRPFISLQQGNFVELIGRADRRFGSATVGVNSNLWGADLTYRRSLLRDCFGRLDLLVGGKFYNLSENLEVNEAIIGFGPDVGLTGFLSEAIRTSNQFYGPSVGLGGETRRGKFSFNVRAQVALGVTWQNVTYVGSQTLTAPPGFGVANGTFPGGLYALDSNLGTRSSARFAAIPELNFQVGYNITERMRFFVGYNFLYWSNVVRPGDQVDPFIDETRIPGFPNFNNPAARVGPSPVPQFRESDFWAQGLNFGLRMDW